MRSSWSCQGHTGTSALFRVAQNSIDALQGLELALGFLWPRSADVEAKLAVL